MMFAAAILASCGSSAIEWRARPPLPPATWHCLATGSGSFCEKSMGACRTAQTYSAQRSVAVKTSDDECRPAREVWCTTYVLTPSREPASREVHSVREAGVDGWVYDCALTQATCQKNQERVVADRARAEEPTSDVAPCERAP